MAGGGGAPVITSGTSRMSWPVPWMTWLRGQWVGGGLGPGELQGEWVGGGPGPGELQGEPPSGAVPALPPHAPFPRAFPHWPHRSASSSAAGQGPGASGCGAGGAASAWGYCWWGRLGPRQSPAPTRPGASCPLATSWPKEAAAGFLAHRPGQLGPAATPGGARCCLGLPAPGAHSLPVQGTWGGSSGRRAAEGPPGLTRTWAWSTCLGGAASSR